MEYPSEGKMPWRKRHATAFWAAVMTLIIGTLSTFFGGYALDWVQARQGQSPNPGGRDDSSPTAASSQSSSDRPVSLEHVAETPLAMSSGHVAGNPIYDVPTFELNGVQCGREPALYGALLDRQYSSLYFIAGVDDSSPEGARVQIRLLESDTVLAEGIVDAGTAGLVVDEELHGDRELRVEMRALTRTADCDSERIRILLMNGVLR